jgi:hypothetical protein
MVVILICPCCASTVYAEAKPEEQTFECSTCGQTWRMVVDADRQVTYSLS